MTQLDAKPMIRIKRRSFFFTLLLPFSALPLLVGDTANGQTKSNVIVIVSDDAGYADFGFARLGLGDGSSNFRDPESGLTIPSLTPNLDALARRGVTMSRAYVAANCQPTRAAIVSGAYQQRTGNENVGNNNYLRNEVFEGIPSESKTIWDRMKAEGYTTGAVGKWHLGSIADSAPNAFDGNRPHNQGIDEFRGIWHGSRAYGVGSVNNNPNSKQNQTQLLRESIATHDAQGNVVSVADRSLEQVYNGEYITNTFGRLATDFIGDHANQANPFMLYQSFTAPHKPWTNESPDYNDPRISGLRDGSFRRQVASLQITMDKEIGNILAKLENPDGDVNTNDSIVDDTLIVFVNDNGGVSGRDNGFDGVDNQPFDGYKGSMRDGGIRVPMLIAGAGIDPAAEGTIYDKPVHGIDILPTALAAAQGSFAPGEEEKIDGVNLLPFINGEDASNPHDVIVSKWQGSFAVIREEANGDVWKLVNTQRNPAVNYNNRENQYRLYKTKDAANPGNSDLDENTNLINGNQSLANELKRDLTRHEATFDKGRFAILARYVDDDLNNPKSGTADILSSSSNVSLREGRNIFDHFVFNPNGGTQNWSTTDGWLAKDGEDNIPQSAAKLPSTDARYSPGKTMYLSDSFAGAIVEFGTSDSQDYVANNDMFRQTGGDFMLNKVLLSGDSGGAIDRSGTIEGNTLLFTKDLDGNGPEIVVDANQSANNKFSYSIDNDIQLFDDLSITGNGDAAVAITGVISDYYSAANADFDAGSRHNTDENFGARGLTKRGTSTVTLMGSNTYSGDTTVEEGTLALSGNGSFENSENILVQAGALLDVRGSAGGFTLIAGQTLMGDGMVDGNVTAAANSIISPGGVAGQLTFDDDFTLNATSTLEIQIGAGAVAGVDYDQIVVDGMLDLGDANLSVTLLSLTSQFQAGDEFQILLGELTGDFNSSGVMLADLGGGLQWDTSQLNTTGLLRIVSAVPEPSSLTLLGGCCLLGTIRRRKN